MEMITVPEASTDTSLGVVEESSFIGVFPRLLTVSERTLNGKHPDELARIRLAMLFHRVHPFPRVDGR